jgi:hypothetical protein
LTSRHATAGFDRYIAFAMQGIQDFLKQYKKPILQSAFDLQSRLTNQVGVRVWDVIGKTIMCTYSTALSFSPPLQVKNNFLFSFLQERGGERDKNYALYNFSFVFAEFLGWLEVIRQEMVFVTGDDDTPLLASLIDGIKFQLTGETPIQGALCGGFRAVLHVLFFTYVLVTNSSWTNF